MRKFAAIYSAENLILLIVLVVPIGSAQPPWKRLYSHLFGASALYAVQSQFAHLVFASHSRFTDGLVAVPFSAATAWFVWISAKGWKQASDLPRPFSWIPATEDALPCWRWRQSLRSRWWDYLNCSAQMSRKRPG